MGIGFGAGLKSLVAGGASTLASGLNVEDAVERRRKSLHADIEKLRSNGGFVRSESQNGYVLPTDARRTSMNRQKNTWL